MFSGYCAMYYHGLVSVSIATQLYIAYLKKGNWNYLSWWREKQWLWLK